MLFKKQCKDMGGTQYMKNVFVPNGTDSIEIINKLAKEEFGDSFKKHNEYTMLKREIIRMLKKMKSRELEENKLETLLEIEHIKQNDFGNFISIRFAYWALMISVAVLIMGTTPIYKYFNMSKKTFGGTIIVLLTILLVTMSRTIHIQHDRLEYLNFKLICFEEIDKSPNKSNENKRK